MKPVLLRRRGRRILSSGVIAGLVVAMIQVTVQAIAPAGQAEAAGSLLSQNRPVTAS